MSENLGMKGGEHRLLADAHERAVGESFCRTHAQPMPHKAVFAKEGTCIQYGDRRFLSGLGYYCEFYPARLNVKHSITRIALRKDRSVLWN